MKSGRDTPPSGYPTRNARERKNPIKATGGRRSMLHIPTEVCELLVDALQSHFVAVYVLLMLVSGAVCARCRAPGGLNLWRHESAGWKPRESDRELVERASYESHGFVELENWLFQAA